LVNWEVCRFCPLKSFPFKTVFSKVELVPVTEEELAAQADAGTMNQNKVINTMTNLKKDLIIKQGQDVKVKIYYNSILSESCFKFLERRSPLFLPLF
jgi:hypothetical protein